jgi:rRNA maturation protein Rpf1
MSEILLTIQEAAELSGKSIQTLRRALKNRKFVAKKKKTPQGFNYLITRESLVAFYKLKNVPPVSGREQGSIKNNEPPVETQKKEITSEYATLEDLKKFQTMFEDLLSNNAQEKEKFMQFMKAFQDRFVVLENQLKLLDQPKKRWFQFWK